MGITEGSVFKVNSAQNTEVRESMAIALTKEALPISTSNVPTEEQSNIPLNRLRQEEGERHVIPAGRKSQAKHCVQQCTQERARGSGPSLKGIARP